MFLKQRQDVLVPVFIPALLAALSEVPSVDTKLLLVVREVREQHLQLLRQLGRVSEDQAVLLVFYKLVQTLEVYCADRKTTPEHVDHLHGQVQTT